MPLPILPPIDTTEMARYRSTTLRRAASRALVERAQAIPPPAYRGPAEIAPPPEPAPQAVGPPIASQDPAKAQLAQTKQGKSLLDIGGESIGTPYVWGGKGPGGFDCSGFVASVYGQAGVKLPAFTDAIAGATTLVDPKDAQPGDIILYKYSDPSQPGVAYPHTGLYAAEGQMLDAQGGKGVGLHPILNRPYEIRRPAGYTPSAVVPNVAAAEALGEPMPAAAPAVPVDLSSREAFARTAGPYAKQIESETGIPAAVMMGIAINEGALAKGTVASQYNNLFGIKATRDWQGQTTPTMGAWEVVNGQNVTQPSTFRAYDSPAESFRDFATFLQQNPRYGEALKKTGDPAAFVQGLKQAGYATDPAWPQKVMSIAGNLPDLGAAAPPQPPETSQNLPNLPETSRTYGSPQEQLADLASRYGGGAPAADFGASAEAQLADLGRRYGIAPMAPSAARTPATAIPDYQAIADQQLAQTAAARAARVAAAAPVPPPEPMPEPVPADTPIPEPGPLPGETPLDRQFGAIPPPTEPYVDPRAAFVGGGGLAPEYAPPEPPPPAPAPVPEPAPEEPYVDPRAQFGLGGGGLAAPPSDVTPAPVPVALPPPEPPANPFERVGRALVDALKGVPEIAGQVGGAVAQAPAGVASAVGETLQRGSPEDYANPAYAAPVFGPSMEERFPAVADVLSKPLPIGALENVPGLGQVARIAGAVEGIRGQPFTGQDVYQAAGGGGGAGFQLPFGVGGGLGKVLGAAERGVIPAAARAAEAVAPAAAEGVIPAAERVAEAVRPIGRLTVEEAAARLAAAAPETVGPRGAGALVLPAEAAAEAVGPRGAAAVVAGAPALPPRIPPAAVAAGESAGREFAGNIRLPKFVDPEVRDLIAQTVDAHPEMAETARRGVMPDAVVRDLAEMAGAKIDDVVKRWKPGQAENSETIYALRQSLVDQAGRVFEAQSALKAVTRGEDPAAALANVANEVTRYKAIQEVVHGVVAEAGRAVHQQRMEVTGFGPGAAEAAAMQRRLDILLSQFKEGGGSMADFEKFIANVPLNDPEAVTSAVQALYHPKLGDYLRWGWYNNLLTNPLRLIRDTTSSAMTAAAVPIEHGFAAPFHALLGTGEGAKFADLPGEYLAMMHATGPGARRAADIMAKSYSPAESLLGGAKTTDIARLGSQEVMKGPLGGAVLNVAGRSIRASDIFFKSLNYDASIYHQAKLLSRGNVDRFHELVKQPTPEMVERAVTEAKYRVFQQDGTFVNTMSKLKGLPGVGPVVTFLAPFHHTPYNLMKYAFERSPFGLLPIGVDVARAAGARAGIPGVTRAATTRAQQADRLGRVAMGSSILLGLEQIPDDKLTGAAPKDPAERDAFYRQGKQPYAIKIGDEWHSYQGLQPFSTLLGGVASIRDAIRRGDVDEGLAAHTLLAFATAQSIVDQPMLSGITGAARAIDDPARYGESWIEQVARSAVPASAFWSSIARSTDNLIRDPEGPVEAAMTAIPGVSHLVPAKLDMFGNPVERAPGQQGLQAFVDITRPTTAKTDPVETELDRLRAAGAKVQPYAVGGSLQVGPEDVKLTREEKRTYQQKAGQLSYAMLAFAMATPEWASTSDEEKANFINRAYGRARTQARGQLKEGAYPRAVEQFQQRQSSGK